MPSPHPFVLERPADIDSALATLADVGDDGRVLSGGQSLVPLLTLGLSAPSVVVSLDRCAGLDQIGDSKSEVMVGAMVTTGALETADLGPSFALVAHAASQIGSHHVRNFGTVVGNVCHADPGSDLVPALLCFDTEISLRSVNGDRSTPLYEFVTGPFATSISPGEIAVGLRFGTDELDGWQHGYRKFVKRSGDLAIATCAVRVRSENGRIADARIVVGGALSRATRVDALEAALVDARLESAGATVSAFDTFEAVEPLIMPDLNAPLDYLRLMLPRFVAATVGEAATGEVR